MSSIERSSHPSSSQVEHLLNCLEKNPHMARGFPRFSSGRDTAKKQWQILAVKLNSLDGSLKSWKQWAKYWSDKKNAIKKKLAQRTTACSGGGDGEVKLTDMEERIIALMGGEKNVISRQNSQQQSSCQPLSQQPPRPYFRRLRHQHESPPEQESDLLNINERLMSAEEQRLELDQRNVELLESLSALVGRQMEREAERDRTIAQGLLSIGEGLSSGLRSIGEGLSSIGEGLKMMAEVNFQKKHRSSNDSP